MVRATPSSKEAELANEQAYFDRALECRERQRDSLRHAPAAAPHKGAAAALKRIADDAIDGLRPPNEAVAFGRFDTESNESRYVGYNAVWSDDTDVLVVNWHAQVATPYFEARHDAPLDVRFRRTFQCEETKIVDFDDLVFREVAAEVASLLEEPEMDDALLTELARTRTGEMQDIVKTIQAAQFQVIRAELAQLLIVQGGAGTGKSAVGLHRVSWLLYNHRDQLDPQDVVLVGPNKTFTRYIRNVLPALGDHGVLHAELESLLGTNVRVTRDESQELAHLKGEPRMRKLLKSGLQDRVRVPDGPLQLRVAGRTIGLQREHLERQVKDWLQLPYLTGRQLLREYLRNEVFNSTGQDRLQDEATESLLERIWPQMTAASFLQELLGSESRLVGAAGDDFSAGDVRRLYRRASDRLADETWSTADVPLLDNADHLLRGEPPRQYGHIVIDEAQDLSPMQLGMIARRSPKGSITVLGDLAQSTGPWARDSWDDVIENLKGTLPVNRVELEFGYRVPRQIFAVAEKVLKVAAPQVGIPRVVRDGPSSPKFIVAEELVRAAMAVGAAREYAGSGYLVGIICAEASRREVVRELDARDVQWSDVRDGTIGSSITLLAAREAKGLEFDAVVVVEPEELVAEDQRGLRLLYISLTRTTRHLTVVHAGAPLPLAVGLQAASVGDGSPDERGRDRSQDVSNGDPLLDGIAAGLASQLRQTTQAQHWGEILNRLRDELLGEIDSEED